MSNILTFVVYNVKQESLKNYKNITTRVIGERICE